MNMDYDRDYLLDHYHHPRNYGTLEQPDVHAEVVNPLCGDKLAMDMNIVDARIAAVRFQGRGCAISQATASILAEMLEGRSVQEVESLDQDTVLNVLGMPISPARTKCAFLSLEVVRSCLKQAGCTIPLEDEERVGR